MSTHGVENRASDRTEYHPGARTSSPSMQVQVPPPPVEVTPEVLVVVQEVEQPRNTSTSSPGSAAAMDPELVRPIPAAVVALTRPPHLQPPPLLLGEVGGEDVRMAAAVNFGGGASSLPTSSAVAATIPPPRRFSTSSPYCSSESGDDNDSVWTDSSDWGEYGYGYEYDQDENENDERSPSPRRNVAAAGGRGGHPQSPPPAVLLSAADIEICQRLDKEYELALEERDIAYAARYQSVRQSACWSVVFMALFLGLGTAFFMQQADWGIADSLFFSVYTITTVGYGELQHPETPAFQLYTIFFIFIGIATLTIMVAQVYQCLALEASRAQHSQDSKILNGAVLLRPPTGIPSPPSGRSGSGEATTADAATSSVAPTDEANSTDSGGRPLEAISIPSQPSDPYVDLAWRCLHATRHFFAHHELGRSLSVLLPFVGLIGIGALVIGPIEGWGVVESLYFSVVSMTTIGYGNYYPTRPVSIWFSIVWLPFSVGFMSLFLANIAAFYIRLSDRNVARIERQLRKHVARAKAQADRELLEARKRALRGQEGYRDGSDGGGVGSDGVELPPARSHHRHMRGFDTVPTEDRTRSNDDDEDEEDDMEDSTHDDDDGGDDLEQAHPRRQRSRAMFGTRRSPKNRREAILRNCRKARRFSQAIINRRQRGPAKGGSSDGSTHKGASSSDENRPVGPTMATMRDVLRTVRRQLAQDGFRAAGPESEFLSIRSSRTVRNTLESSSSTILKPSFALRALVQERYSEIIASEVAGYSSNIEIHDNTLSVTIDSLRQTADKWLVPRRARKAFRAVCFEALFFVGEHGLIVRGADALYDLTPIEFHGLFAPLLAAMGDAETMEGWLASTEVLAEVDLPKDGLTPQQQHQRHQASGGAPQLRGVVRRDPDRPTSLTGGDTSVSSHRAKPPNQLTTPGNAFAAASRSMQYA